MRSSLLPRSGPLVNYVLSKHDTSSAPLDRSFHGLSSSRCNPQCSPRMCGLDLLQGFLKTRNYHLEDVHQGMREAGKEILTS